jgi:hypothetical protein
LLEIFVESHFTFSCDDVLNTIFKKNLNVALFRFYSNSWFARGRGGYKKEKGEKSFVNQQKPWQPSRRTMMLASCHLLTLCLFLFCENYQRRNIGNYIFKQLRFNTF